MLIPSVSKNASYRGVPVKSYEFWYEPETDYVFENYTSKTISLWS